ncbi:MAG: protoporphyrinogen oxidase [Acidobacteriota bacterium]
MEAGCEVRVLEASGRVGGTVRSGRVQGHLFEAGPTTVPSTAPRLGALIDDLDLRPRVILSRKMAGRRLVWRRGRLHSLPESPPQLLTCTALGPLGKARLLMEPLVPARRQGDDETLLEFGQRRLGRDATAAFLDPFVTGVFAGRLDRLGVDALPKLLDLESGHGSLLRGVVASRRAAKQARPSGQGTRPQGSGGPPPLVSFAGGLEDLPRALEQRLRRRGVVFDLASPASAVEPTPGGLRVLRACDGDDRGSLGADLVIVATPASSAAGLLPTARLREGSAHAAYLEGLDHPFVTTVGLGYRRSDVDHPLDAFGLLVASDSRPASADVLGILFASSIFPGRSPEGEVTLTVMVGGARDPGAADLDDDGLLNRARRAATTMLGVRGEPVAVSLQRWPRAIPQFPPGHRRRVARLRSDLATVPGLALAGNYLDGVGVEGAVASADAAVEAALASASAGPGDVGP